MDSLFCCLVTMMTVTPQLHHQINAKVTNKSYSFTEKKKTVSNLFKVTKQIGSVGTLNGLGF